MIEDAPFDRGLQPERTALAWHRATLALALASVVAIRFTAPSYGRGAVIAGSLGLLAAAAAGVGSRVRYRRIHTALRATATLDNIGAWPLVALTVSTVAVALMGLLYLSAAPLEPIW